MTLGRLLIFQEVLTLLGASRPISLSINLTVLLRDTKHILWQKGSVRNMTLIIERYKSCVSCVHFPCSSSFPLCAIFTTLIFIKNKKLTTKYNIISSKPKRPEQCASDPDLSQYKMHSNTYQTFWSRLTLYSGLGGVWKIGYRSCQF